VGDPTPLAGAPAGLTPPRWAGGGAYGERGRGATKSFAPSFGQKRARSP
jgi:hypothetical protein